MQQVNLKKKIKLTLLIKGHFSILINSVDKIYKNKNNKLNL